MKYQEYLLALLRVGMGWVFLWPFLDKVFGLGYATKAGAGWLAGNSPTVGFLKNATKGPFAEFYQNIAGHPIVDWLFMIGLLLIGLALISGLLVKIAAYSGALMMVLMFSAVLPPAQNPLIDDHIIYALLLLLLAAFNAGNYWGLGQLWSKQPAVQKYQNMR